MTSRVARPGLIRQGDVLLIPVDPDVVEGSAPGSRRVLDRIDGRLVLAEGEATGHAHAIVDGHVRLEEQEFGELREVWRNRWAWSGSRTVLIVEGSPATLQHEEHGHLAVPPGGLPRAAAAGVRPEGGTRGGLEKGRRLMPARRRTDLAARSIRFGRLDRALGRLDRERAENAIHAVATARRARVVWAGDLVEAVELVAARRSHHLVVPPGAREWRVSFPRIRDSEESRIANVARIDRLIL